MADRIELLSGRVRWLDRYRRTLSISAAAVIAPLLILQFIAIAGDDWPQLHVTALSVVIGVVAWWFVEVALAWLTAIWETECDRLSHDHDVPRAELVTPRRRGFLRRH